jgi:predicted ArsR family transcriptional regulator
MRPDPAAPAREKILFLLKTRGPQPAAKLAGRLGVTTMAVRQHLQRLEADGLVDHTDERHGVGRPVKLWRATSAADARFPDTHADLTVDLIEGVREAFGEDGLDMLIRQRNRKHRARYLERMPGPDASLADRVARLAALRREEGYMAEWSRRRDGSFLLVENHCPICAAATACTGLCREELALFRSVLGPDAEVERSEHLLEGARRCVYGIRER